jgi:hypothetical protein
VDGQGLVGRDRDPAAQAVEGEAAGEIGCGGALAVDQHVRAAFRSLGVPEDEVEQGLALRREQTRPERPLRGEQGDVVGDEPLEEGADVLAGEAEQSAVEEGGRGHDPLIGTDAPKPKAT